MRSCFAFVVTLQQIARTAGCSLATVSYALRDDPCIRAVTRAHVQGVARRLGYRPNPRVAALMAHIRRSRQVSAGERIAFVWVHTSRQESQTDPFLVRVFEGARARADALGYQIEQFWTGGRGLSDRRLFQVLRSRGIVGVLLSPVLHEAEVALEVDWSGFAPAVVGSTRWNPEMHHAGHHHYQAMRLALEKLEARGCGRPLALIDEAVNERARRAWQAAFLVYHPNQDAAAELLMIGLRDSRAALRRRFRMARPDALIVSEAGLLDRLARLGLRWPAADTVSLHWTSARPELAGIDQDWGLIAANAVDLVVSQLSSNETGAPASPRMLLFPGRWVEAGCRAEPAAGG